MSKRRQRHSAEQIVAKLRAIQPKSFQPKTTQSRHRLGYNQNLLSGRAKTTRVNEVWVGDITYIPLGTRTSSGRFGYLALLMDLHSRRIVGWEFGSSMEENLVLRALSRAIATRRHAATQVQHQPLETFRVRLSGFGERHGNDRLALAVAALDAGDFGEQRDRLAAEGRRAPAFGDRSPPDHVGGGTVRTGQLAAIMPQRNGDAPSCSRIDWWT